MSQFVSKLGQIASLDGLAKTITDTVWNGTAIGVVYGGTGLATIASGKLLYASASNTLAELTLGTNLSITGGTLNAAGGANPAGSGSELQFRSSGSAFGAVTGSSVSGANITLAGSVSIPSTGLIGTGGDLKVFAGVNPIFRGLLHSGWTDTAAATFFQVGASNGNTIFATGNGNIFPRLLFNATAVQFVSGEFYNTASIPTAPLEVLTANAATNTIIEGRKVRARSTGTTAAGFGIRDRWQLESTTTDGQEAATIDVLWADATHASRKARVVHSVYDTAVRECLRLETNGTSAMAGFLGATAVVRQAVTGSRTDGTALASLLTGLANLGLITDSSSA